MKSIGGYVLSLRKYFYNENYHGSGSTLVTINTMNNPFSFYLRDVNPDFPIYIPEYKVIVTIADDLRDLNLSKLPAERSSIKQNL